MAWFLLGILTLLSGCFSVGWEDGIHLNYRFWLLSHVSAFRSHSNILCSGSFHYGWWDCGDIGFFSGKIVYGALLFFSPSSSAFWTVCVFGEF